MKKIKLYHMSETLKLGDELMPDGRRNRKKNETNFIFTK